MLKTVYDDYLEIYAELESAGTLRRLSVLASLVKSEYNHLVVLYKLLLRLACGCISHPVSVQEYIKIREEVQNNHQLAEGTIVCRSRFMGYLVERLHPEFDARNDLRTA
jgi:hypothetical protein